MRRLTWEWWWYRFRSTSNRNGVRVVFLNCKKQKKQKNRASSRQTRTHDGSGTPKKYVCVCTRCMVTNSFICIVHPILEVYLWYTYIHTQPAVFVLRKHLPLSLKFYLRNISSLNISSLFDRTLVLQVSKLLPTRLPPSPTHPHSPSPTHQDHGLILVLFFLKLENHKKQEIWMSHIGICSL